MNKLTITGNLTRDPESKTTNNGVFVSQITVAVNRRGAGGNQETTYFRVSCWRGLGENVQKYLKKGAKVLVAGPVRAHAWISNDGAAHCQMEIDADDIEFLNTRAEAQAAAMQAADPEPDPEQKPADLSNFTPVDDDELPF